MWLYHGVLMSLVTDGQSPLSPPWPRAHDKLLWPPASSGQRGQPDNSPVSSGRGHCQQCCGCWGECLLSLCSASAHTIPHTSPLPTPLPIPSYLPVPFCSVLSLGSEARIPMNVLLTRIFNKIIIFFLLIFQTNRSIFNLNIKLSFKAIQQPSD